MASITITTSLAAVSLLRLARPLLPPFTSRRVLRLQAKQATSPTQSLAVEGWAGSLSYWIRLSQADL